MLSTNDLRVSYGMSEVIHGVSLNVGENETLTIMGRNGMGKTTTIKTVCRMMDHGAGKIEFAGTDLSRLPAHKAARLGIGLVPEGRRCFAKLSVWENLIAAARPGEWDFDRVTDLFPRLGERRDQAAMTLSGGEQQMLAIGRALMTNPRLLILDEATEGLAPVVRQEIWAAVTRLKQAGLSILVVDKSLRELTGVADRCVIIEKGCTAWTGGVADLSPDITDRYLGV
jgi:branched-chain amino acid transport system ATP-binding protein